MLTLAPDGRIAEITALPRRPADAARFARLPHAPTRRGRRIVQHVQMTDDGDPVTPIRHTPSEAWVVVLTASAR